MGLVLQCPKRSSTLFLFLFLTKKENRVHPHRSRHTQRWYNTRLRKIADRSLLPEKILRHPDGGRKKKKKNKLFLFLVRAHVPTRHLHALSWLKKIFPTEIGQGRSRRAHTTGSEINKKIRATMSAGGQTPERVTTHKPTRERNMEKHMSNEAIPVPGLYISWLVHTHSHMEKTQTNKSHHPTTKISYFWTATT